MNKTHTFPAVQGEQNDYVTYLIQCPIYVINTLSITNEKDVSPPIRRGQTLDPSRIQEFIQIFSSPAMNSIVTPLVASINIIPEFEPISQSMFNMGIIYFPSATKLIIIDGQHRIFAIQHLIDRKHIFRFDIIPVMIIVDKSFEKSRQLYISLNQQKTPLSRSKQILYDQDDLAILVQNLVNEVPLFQNRIELEKTTISNRSQALFTLSAIYQATEALLGSTSKKTLSKNQLAVAQQFWLDLSDIILEWQKIIKRELTAAYLRNNFVHSHTVTLLAIGLAGRALIEDHPETWRTRLKLLQNVDWSRTNEALWEGRSMIQGRMSKTSNSIRLTTIVIKRMLELNISSKDMEVEKQLVILRR